MWFGRAISGLKKLLQKRKPEIMGNPAALSSANTETLKVSRKVSIWDLSVEKVCQDLLTDMNKGLNEGTVFFIEEKAIENPCMGA